MSQRVEEMEEAFTEKLSGSLREAYEQLEREKSRMDFREAMLAYGEGFRFGLRLAFEVVHGAP